MKKFFSLIAAVLFAGSMFAAEVTVSKTVPELVTAYSWENGSVVTPFALDEVITVSTEATDANTGKYYVGGQQVRLYQTGAAKLIISAAEGYSISSITLTYVSYNTGILKEAESGVAVNFDNVKSATFTVGNSGTATNGQVRLTAFSVTYNGEGGDPTPVVEYYVVGTMNNWQLNADYKLAANPGQAGEYMKRFTFAATDELKVRKAVDGVLDTWYPEGMGNNWVITADGDYDVYFRPEGNSEWANNYFFVAPYVIPTYNVAEAIAAGLKENDEIKVRGVVTKMQIKGKNFAQYGSVNFFVADATGAEGEFEFYNCYSFNADTFKTTSPAYDADDKTVIDLKKVKDGKGNEIRLGDTIVAFGQYKLFGTTYELNTGCYIVENKPAPVKPAETINVNMSEGLYFRNCVEAEGWWQIYGDNAQYSVSVSNVSTTQAEGTYTIDDLDADFTYVGIINGTDTAYVYFEDGSVTLSIAANGDVTVAGTLVGDDGNNYVFNLVFVTPKPQAEVNVSITDGELYDEYAASGLYGVYGMDTNNVYVQLGIWTEDGLQGSFTDQDLDFAYIGSFIEEGDDYVEIYSASIAVVPGNGNDYSITATILGYNNKQYNVTMLIPNTTTGIEETVADGKVAKVLRNGQILIKKGDKTFNVLGATVR